MRENDVKKYLTFLVLCSTPSIFRPTSGKHTKLYILLFHVSMQVITFLTSYTIPSASRSFLVFLILKNVFFCLPSLFS